MEMARKTAKILTIQRETPSFIIEELELINYKVTTARVEAQETILIREIESSVKHCDVVLFVGALGTSYSFLVWKAIAKVFHQQLVENKHLVHYTSSREEYTTVYAKCFECRTNGTFPIMYIQGLFLLTDDSKVLRLSVVNILVPFLKQLKGDIVLRRKLIIDGAPQLPNDGNVQVSVHIKLNSLEVRLTSSDMVSLLHYENSLIENCKILHSCEDTHIEQSVYNYQNLHVKKSVEYIEECFKRYGPENVFVSFNGGKDCTVLLHLTIGVLRRNYPLHRGKICCVYMENANPFPQLNKFIEQCRQYYDLDLIKFTKSIKDSLTDVLIAKSNMKAVLMGTRRTDPFSEHLQPFHMTDSNWPQVMRVSPILDWHYSEVWDYLLHLKVPYCSLYDDGYTSLGSMTNTLQNPFLLVSKGNDKAGYLPAYKLLDASQERSGRLRN